MPEPIPRYTCPARASDSIGERPRRPPPPAPASRPARNRPRRRGRSRFSKADPVVVHVERHGVTQVGQRQHHPGRGRMPAHVRQRLLRRSATAPAPCPAAAASACPVTRSLDGHARPRRPSGGRPLERLATVARQTTGPDAGPGPIAVAPADFPARCAARSPVARAPPAAPLVEDLLRRLQLRHHADEALRDRVVQFPSEPLTFGQNRPPARAVSASCGPRWRPARSALRDAARSAVPSR